MREGYGIVFDAQVDVSSFSTNDRLSLYRWRPLCVLARQNEKGPLLIFLSFLLLSIVSVSSTCLCVIG